MILTPKLRFLENRDYAISHRDLVVNTAFRSACEAALAEIIMSASPSTTPTDAIAAAYRIEGARQFIAVLFNLAETPKPPGRLPSHDNLNHAITK